MPPTLPGVSEGLGVNVGVGVLVAVEVGPAVGLGVVLGVLVPVGVKGIASVVQILTMPSVIKLELRGFSIVNSI